MCRRLSGAWECARASHAHASLNRLWRWWAALSRRTWSENGGGGTNTGGGTGAGVTRGGMSGRSASLSGWQKNATQWRPWARAYAPAGTTTRCIWNIVYDSLVWFLMCNILTFGMWHTFGASNFVKWDGDYEISHHYYCNFNTNIVQGTLYTKQF